MWGIQKLNEKCLILYGITPTYVGNTTGLAYCQLVEEDHPHLCGEYSSIY